MGRSPEETDANIMRAIVIVLVICIFIGIFIRFAFCVQSINPTIIVIADGKEYKGITNVVIEGDKILLLKGQDPSKIDIIKREIPPEKIEK